MHEDLKGADRMISRLSELLRITLANIGKQQVTLAEELDFVHTYLEIERVRFGERLATETDVAPELLEALVPALFLQPLVENCVRHGLSQQEDGLILIRAVQRDDRLVLTISDNGRGLPGSRPLREGLGLANTRKRLQHLYPQDHGFTVEAGAPSGVVVTAEIPFHTARAVAQAGRELVSDEYQNSDRGRRAVGADADRYAPQL
jgi:two-component system LytT family sensor kinase